MLTRRLVIRFFVCHITRLDLERKKMVKASTKSLSVVVSYLLLILTTTTVAEPQEHHYHFVIDAVTSNEFSPDCEDLESSYRYLFLVSDSNSPDSKPSMPGPTIEVSNVQK